MANFDPNHWQQITIGSSTSGQGQSMDGSVLYTKEGRGSVFFGNTNLNSTEQLWQIYTFNSSYYVLRTQGSGPQGYMGTGLNPDEATPGKTVPGMANSSVSDDSMFWKISPWGDGTFFLTNAANGSAWHLTLKSNSLMAMTSNITAPQDPQRFSFTQLGTIDDVKFSSVITASTTPTSTPSTTATNTQPPSQTTSQGPATHKGISSGAAAGIGVGIGVVAILLTAIVGVVLLRRRKKARAAKAQPMAHEISAEPPFQHMQEYKPAQELPVHMSPVELSGMNHDGERRAELPGHH